MDQGLVLTVEGIKKYNKEQKNAPPQQVPFPKFKLPEEPPKPPTPLETVNNVYQKLEKEPPTSTFSYDPKTCMFTCKFNHDGKEYQAGISRHKQTAANIAACHFVEGAIRNGDIKIEDYEAFNLINDKDLALEMMEMQRKELIELFEENFNPVIFINDYLEFDNYRRRNVSRQKYSKKHDQSSKREIKYSQDGPPFTATIPFYEKKYTGEAAETKVAAKWNAAWKIVDMLVDDGNYEDYKKRLAEKKKRKAVTKAMYEQKKLENKLFPKMNEPAAKKDGLNNANKKNQVSQPNRQRCHERKKNRRRGTPGVDYCPFYV